MAAKGPRREVYEAVPGYDEQNLTAGRFDNWHNVSQFFRRKQGPVVMVVERQALAGEEDQSPADDYLIDPA